MDDIVQPADGTYTSYRVARPAVGGYSLRAADKPFTPRGEALRGRTNPSVTELMIRRFESGRAGTPRQQLPRGHRPEHAGQVPAVPGGLGR